MNIVPCFWDVGPWCAGWIVEKFMFPLSIAYVVYRFALYQIGRTRAANLEQLDRKRQIDFADKQLSEFYAPMVGARAEILSHSNFADYVDYAYLAVKQRRNRKLATLDEGTIEYEQEIKIEEAEFLKYNEGRNRRLLGERTEAYIAMRELFAKKMAYADEDTRSWYEYLYGYVEAWRIERDTERFLSADAWNVLGTLYDEDLLTPFYHHLNERVNQLQSEIQGKPRERTKAPMPPTLKAATEAFGASGKA